MPDVMEGSVVVPEAEPFEAGIEAAACGAELL
jgi:hypothetical protein